MKNISRIVILAIGICFAFQVSAAAQTATTSVRFTNDNLASTTQPAPIDTGADVGSLSAIPLEQNKTLEVYRNAVNGVRIWKFVLDDAFWFVTDKGVIWGTNGSGLQPQATTDEEAYRVYLAMPQHN